LTIIKFDAGFALTVSMYHPDRYSSDVVRIVLETLVSAGLQPTRADLYKVRPEQADDSSLYLGEYQVARVELDSANKDLPLDRMVLTECVLYWQLPDRSVCDVRVKTKFYRDGTFGMNLDFPYSYLFEEPRLTEPIRRYLWMEIETLAMLLFESGQFFYGGIYFEEDAPCLLDLTEKERILPVDFAFYSSAVVETLGRAALLETLIGANALRHVTGGAVYFAWSSLFESEEQVSVPTRFRAFVERFKPGKRGGLQA